MWRFVGDVRFGGIGDGLLTGGGLALADIRNRILEQPSG